MKLVNSQVCRRASIPRASGSGRQAKYGLSCLLCLLANKSIEKGSNFELNSRKVDRSSWKSDQSGRKREK